MIRTKELDDSISLWEKQPAESDKAWNAFQIYRDLADKRSFQAVADKLNLSHTAVRAHASRWDWRTRADAFDRHQDEENRRAMARGRLEMRERQGKLGMAMQSIGTQGLKELQAKLAAGTPLGLTVDECVRMISEGAKIERSARGEDAEAQYTKINVIIGRTVDKDMLAGKALPGTTDKEEPPTLDGDSLAEDDEKQSIQ